MASMGKGYGSEAHLLRFMGRHRNIIDSKCLEVLGGSSIHWLDFGFNYGAEWQDAELKGIDFLPNAPQVQEAWAAYWPQGRGIHNWDAVGVVTSNGEEAWVLVEAKANIEELRSDCQAKEGGSGLAMIERAFRQTKERLGVEASAIWLRAYYQYANRVAALNFLDEQGVSAHLLFIYFIGDRVPGKTCPSTEEEWYSALEEQTQHLGLPEEHALKARIHTMFLQTYYTDL